MWELFFRISKFWVVIYEFVQAPCWCTAPNFPNGRNAGVAYMYILEMALRVLREYVQRNTEIYDVYFARDEIEPFNWCNWCKKIFIALVLLTSLSTSMVIGSRQTKLVKSEHALQSQFHNKLILIQMLCL